LEIVGDIKIADGTQGPGKVLTSDATGLASWQTPPSGGGGSGTFISDTDNDTKVQTEESIDEDKIRFDTAGFERMVIDEAGNVGIGTTTPAEQLHVENPTSGGRAFLQIETSHATNWHEAGLRIKTPQNTWHLRLDDDLNNNVLDGSLGLRSGDLGTEVMVWAEAGNVGIGTINPNNLFNRPAKLRNRSHCRCLDNLQLQTMENQYPNHDRRSGNRKTPARCSF